MKINKPGNENKDSGRSLEEDLQRLDEAGINLGGKEKEADKKDAAEAAKPVPETKEQQKTGDTSRSDRRL